MLTGKIEDTIIERKKFLDIWASENILRHLTNLKRNLSTSQITHIYGHKLVNICNELIDMFIEEYQYWYQVELTVTTLEQIIPQRMLQNPLIGIRDIQKYIASINEMIRTWGNSEKYISYFLEVSNVILNILSSTEQDQEFNEFLSQFRITIQKLNQLPSIESKLNYLKAKSKFVKEFLLQENYGVTSILSNQTSQTISDEFRENESFPFGRTKNKFDLIRSHKFYSLKLFSRFFIPESTKRIEYSKRNHPVLTKYIISEILTDFNNYFSYFGTIRSNFRIGERNLHRLISNLELKPGMKFLEIYGNIPILSLVATFLGLSASVIDYQYEYGLGSVSKLIKEINNHLLDENNIGRTRDAIDDFLRSEDFINQLDPEMTGQKIKFQSMIELTKKMIPEVQRMITFINLDLKSISENLDKFPARYFDIIFIDPPFNKQTSYMNQNSRSLIENSIKLAKVWGHPEAKLAISLPVSHNNDDIVKKWREDLFSILDELNGLYTIPNQQKRYLRFNF